MKRAGSLVLLALLYLGAPLLLLALGRQGLRMIIPFLIVAALACAAFMSAEQRRDLWRLAPPRELGRVLRRFALGAPLLVAAVLLWMPGSFLALPRRRPDSWLMICLLYPLLSAYPQEVIYRAFFDQRMRRLLPVFHGFGLLLLNGAVFGFGHVMFRSIWSVLLTVVAGVLFADTYRRTRSVPLAALEHGLWGDLVFTIGMGALFYGGSVAAHL